MNVNKLMYDMAVFHGGRLPSHSFPGFYPMFYITNKDEVVCADCANGAQNDNQIITQDINWEHDALYCDCCSTRIESAYGEDGAE